MSKKIQIKSSEEVAAQIAASFDRFLSQVGDQPIIFVVHEEIRRSIDPEEITNKSDQSSLGE